MSDDLFSWLPDHHLGAPAMLAHVDEVIERLSDVVFTHQSRSDFVTVGDRQIGAVNQVIVEAIAPTPRKLPLLLADALVDLRAALEHTLFAEVEFLDGTLDEDAARRVEIPACDDPNEFARWVNKRKRGPASLRNDTETVRRIEALQPYHWSADPGEHPLARLVSHTNHMKHRTPAVTALRIGAVYREDQVLQPFLGPSPRPEQPAEVGTVLVETPIGAKVEVSFFPTIGLHRPGTERWPVLMQEIAEIAHWVRVVGVPLLITGKTTAPVTLPARFDISVGHRDERSAMAGGSRVPAFERSQQRIMAAQARQSLIEMVVECLSADLSRDQVAAWVGSLDDAEVAQRGGRFMLFDLDDAELARQNSGVIKDMLIEVISFNERSAK